MAYCDTAGLTVERSTERTACVVSVGVAGSCLDERLSLRSMSNVTRILSQIEDADPRAEEELLPLVY